MRQFAPAKDRVERANATLQGRLVKELRYANISTAEAKAFLPNFIAKRNAKFTKLPSGGSNAHRVAPPIQELDQILTVQHERRVSKNLTVHLENHIYEILMSNIGRRLQHGKVMVRVDRNAEITIEHRETVLPHRIALTQRRRVILNAKDLALRQPPEQHNCTRRKVHVS